MSLRVELSAYWLMHSLKAATHSVSRASLELNIIIEPTAVFIQLIEILHPCYMLSGIRSTIMESTLPGTR